MASACLPHLFQTLGRAEAVVGEAIADERLRLPLRERAARDRLAAALRKLVAERGIEPLTQGL